MPFGKKPPSSPPVARRTGPGPGAPPPSPPAGAQGDAGTSRAQQLPWASQPDSTGCNFALAHLRANLRGRIADARGRLHAETYVAAAGVVAGYAAQASLLADREACEHFHRIGELMILTTSDGRSLLFGEALNSMLLARSPSLSNQRVYNLLAGSAIAAGAAPEALPPPEKLFEHVASAIGKPGEGFPDLPDNRPMLSYGELLKRVWPMAHSCLTGDISDICRKNGFAARPSSWAAVTAYMAADAVVEVAGVLAPPLAHHIALEGAIYGSKVLVNWSTAQA